MKFSVVIPVHNEGRHIEAGISRFIQTLPGDVAAVLMEIVLVENGSRDDTYDACCRSQEMFPNLVRVCRIPRGSYGEAIKKGMLESRGSHVCILECDLLESTFLAASMNVFRADRAQFVVGSKRHPHSLDGRPLKRRVLTALYNFMFLRVMIGYPGTDTHGLKAIETAVAKRLCELAVTTDEIFQTEIVLLAWRLGVRIEEVPIRILEMRNPSVTVIRRVPKVLHTVRELKKSLARFSPNMAQVPNKTGHSHSYIAEP